MARIVKSACSATRSSPRTRHRRTHAAPPLLPPVRARGGAQKVTPVSSSCKHELTRRKGADRSSWHTSVPLPNLACTSGILTLRAKCAPSPTCHQTLSGRTDDRANDASCTHNGEELRRAEFAPGSRSASCLRSGRRRPPAVSLHGTVARWLTPGTRCGLSRRPAR